MKSKISVFLSVIVLLTSQFAQAQGTIYLSNLGQSPVGSKPIGNDAWIAQEFRTGTNASGYALNSIKVLMNQASGSPSGFNASIYNLGLNVPGTCLGSLSGLDPATAGTYVYTASSIELLPSNTYFLVLTSATPVALGAYTWSAANTYLQNPVDPWALQNVYFSSADGSSWASHLRQEVFQLELSATAAPEPKASVLVGLGLVVMSFWRRNLRRVK